MLCKCFDLLVRVPGLLDTKSHFVFAPFCQNNDKIKSSLNNPEQDMEKDQKKGISSLYIWPRKFSRACSLLGIWS